MTHLAQKKFSEEKLLNSQKRKARDGWKEAFNAPKNEKNKLLLEPIENQFDKEEWEW